MPDKQKSPLTGHAVEVQHDRRRFVTYFDDICGRWAVTEEADFGQARMPGGRLQTEARTLTPVDTRKVLALARSEVWRTVHIENRTPLFMTTPGARQQDPAADPKNRILTFDQLYELSHQLTLERKAFLTLENLSAAEAEIGAGVIIPYFFPSYPGEPTWRTGEPPAELGITYGATEKEAPLVYQLLLKKDWISIDDEEAALDDETRVFITPEGYSRLDELSRGRSEIAQAFLVCRFIPQMDDLFEEVYRPVGDEIRCPVLRIKDVHHVDKIDDRICQEIRRSRVVVVDLTEHNFNVAFEAGYALALDKPIVWTKRKEVDGPKMPFDIYTYNCLEWQPEKIDEFRRDLKFRLMAAIDKTRSRG